MMKKPGRSHMVDRLEILITKTLCGRSQDRKGTLTIVGEKDFVDCARCKELMRRREVRRERERDARTGRLKRYTAEEWRKKLAREEASGKSAKAVVDKASRQRRWRSRKNRADRELIRRVREEWVLTAEQLHFVLGGVLAGRSLSYTRKCCQPMGFAKPIPIYLERARDLLASDPTGQVLDLVGQARDDYPDTRGEHTRNSKRKCQRSMLPIPLLASDAAPEVHCPECKRCLRPLRVNKDGLVVLPYHNKHKPRPKARGPRQGSDQGLEDGPESASA